MEHGLQLVAGRSARKSSYISRTLNDPRLLEVLSPSVADLYSRLPPLQPGLLGLLHVPG